MQTTGNMAINFAEVYDTSSTPATFGQTLTRTVYISSDVLTAGVMVTFNMPYVGSECMLTVRHVYVAGVGRNLPCHQQLEGEHDIASTTAFTNSQMQASVFYLNTITNVGKEKSSLSNMFDRYRYLTNYSKAYWKKCFIIELR